MPRQGINLSPHTPPHPLRPANEVYEHSSGFLCTGLYGRCWLNSVFQYGGYTTLGFEQHDNVGCTRDQRLKSSHLIEEIWLLGYNSVCIFTRQHGVIYQICNSSQLPLWEPQIQALQDLRLSLLWLIALWSCVIPCSLTRWIDFSEERVTFTFTV
jgi:hypothetical protein